MKNKLYYFYIFVASLGCFTNNTNTFNKKSLISENINTLIETSETKQKAYVIPSSNYTFAQLSQLKVKGLLCGIYPVYWLELPKINDAVLIQMHEHNTNPTINLETNTANFSFIDPSKLYPNKRFQLLPPGLYCWKNTTYRATQKKNRNQNVDDNFVVQSYPGEGKFALSNKGIYKGAYVPAITLKNEYQWTSNPSYIKFDPLEPYATGNMKSNLSIASCNVLFEDFYKKYSKTTQTMANDERTYFFLQSFQAGGIFYDTDIICFQEWLLQSNFMKKMLSQYGFALIEPQVQQKNFAACCIAYKPSKINAKTSKSFKLETKLCVSAELSYKNTLFNIYSIHVPSQMMQNTQQQLNNVHNVVHDATQWLQKNNGFAIIAGDFNYNIYGTLNKAPTIGSYRQRIDNIKPYNALTAIFIKNNFTDLAAKYNKLFYPTAYDNGFAKLDYIWYSQKINNNTLMPVNYVVYPINLKKLIKHNNPQQNDGPIFSTYFSDHAVIKGYFRLN